MAVGIVAVVTLLMLTGNEVIAGYGSVLLASLVYLWLFGRADRRGEIHWAE